jgi:predicted site-specific integrase-resolvase
MEQVAERLQIRRETLFRWSCSGRFPVAILRLGAARRIRAAELADWILAGCPSRAAWRWPENPSKGT